MFNATVECLEAVRELGRQLLMYKRENARTTYGGELARLQDRFLGGAAAIGLNQTEEKALLAEIDRLLEEEV